MFNAANLFFLIGGLFLFKSHHHEDPEARWIVKRDSRITINGTTNVNQFSCQLPEKEDSDTLMAMRPSENCLKFKKGLVRINPESFDCGNNVMTQDFLETIKVDQHPYIFIDFLNLEIEEVDGLRVVPGDLQITLAGKTKTYKIDFSINRIANNQINLSGFKKVHFSEFDLQPPVKFFGLVKVQESIDVTFDLRLKRIS